MQTCCCRFVFFIICTVVSFFGHQTVLCVVGFLDIHKSVLLLGSASSQKPPVIRSCATHKSMALAFLCWSVSDTMNDDWWLSRRCAHQQQHISCAKLHQNQSDDQSVQFLHCRIHSIPELLQCWNSTGATQNLKKLTMEGQTAHVLFFVFNLPLANFSIKSNHTQDSDEAKPNCQHTTSHLGCTKQSGPINLHDCCAQPMPLCWHGLMTTITWPVEIPHTPAIWLLWPAVWALRKCLNFWNTALMSSWSHNKHWPWLWTKNGAEHACREDTQPTRVDLPCWILASCVWTVQRCPRPRTW